MTHIDKLLQAYPDLMLCKEALNQAFAVLYETVASGGRIYVCGNGGSAADCQHIVGELMKGFLLKRPVKIPPDVKQKLSRETFDFLSGTLQGAIPCHSLTAETALITALSNDISADIVFAQQIYGYGRKGDALVAISTSGNAVNVCLAAELATAMGLRTVVLTGLNGGKLKNLCEVVIQVPSDSTPRIQEYHLPVYHALCAALEESFFG
jgi:D-sedoheptulose 7-phosphate isomerase